MYKVKLEGNGLGMVLSAVILITDYGWLVLNLRSGGVAAYNG